MSAVLFGRKASLIVGGRRFDEGLRISFDVEKKGGRDPNKATIVVANLTESTRAEITPKGLTVVLEAGYESNAAGIFFGKTFRVTHAREGADFLTRIEASDGGKEIKEAVGSWSFGPSAQVVQAIRTLVAAMGLPLSSGSALTPRHPTFRNGFSFAGRAIDALDTVVTGAGLSWSIQDGQVQVLSADGDGAPDVVLTSDSGMVGSPTRGEVDDKTKKERVTVRCLINPQIRPGRRVLVSSFDQPSLSGRYLVDALRATGDTHGDDWTMSLSVTPLAP